MKLQINLKWDCIKCLIRSKTIEYSVQRSKLLKLKEKELEQKLQEYESNSSLLEAQYDEYIGKKREYKNLQDRKTRGIIMRSKAKWTEEGEKNTSYFLNLEKRNYETKHIQKLIVSEKP